MSSFKKPSYVHQYKDQTLLIKASGKELNEDFFCNVKELVKYGVKAIIPYGGGVMIDQYWNKFSHQPRTKKNGVGITSREVMDHAVMPAYDESHARIDHFFSDCDKNVLFPENIKCDYKDIWAYGEVGTIQSIHGIDFDRSLNFIGFVGDANTHMLNINADEIVTYMVEHYAHKINEVLFISDQPGLLDKNDTVIPIIFKSRIDTILSGNDRSISVSGGMVKKLQEIQFILEKIPKVVLTQGVSLYDEINHWKGKGTMFIDESKLTFGDLTNPLVFYQVYTQHVYENIFRSRSYDEVEDTIARHKVLSLGNTILGGLSIQEVGNHHMFVECLWASHIGTGLGSLILDYAKRLAYRSRRHVFFISQSQKLASSFDKNNFYNHGSVAEYILRGDQKEIQEYLREYPRERQNSFVYKRKGTL